MKMIEDVVNRYRQNALEKQQIVSVFMLTYNRAHYLKLAVQAFLEQTYENFQLIILDNCSQDNTREVVESINDKRVLYIRRAHEAKCHNVQFAVNVCTTKYMVIAHDDDEVYPNYLEKMLQKMENGGYTVATCGATLIDSESVPFGVSIRKDLKGDAIYSGSEYLQHFFQMRTVGMLYPSAVYRTAFYKDFPDFAGKKEIGPAGDQWIWFETERRGGTLCFVNEQLFRYRIHKQQDSNLNAGFMELQLLDYLMEQPYYAQQLLAEKDSLFRTVWRAHMLVSRNFYREIIDSGKYAQIFGFAIVKKQKEWTKGRLCAILMKETFGLRKPLRWVAKFLRIV